MTLFNKFVYALVALFPMTIMTASAHASECYPLDVGLKHYGITESEIFFKTVEDTVMVTYYVHIPDPIKNHHYGTIVMLEECMMPDHMELLTDAEFLKAKEAYEKNMSSRTIRDDDEN